MPFTYTVGQCVICGELFDRAVRANMHPPTCSPRCRAVQFRRRHPAPERKPKLLKCRWCGDPIVQPGGPGANRKSCDVCGYRAYRIWARGRVRAISAGVAWERFDVVAVFERDEWTCQICFAPVEAFRRHPDPLSPSLDHRVPLSDGGTHVFANVQATHFRCNIQKDAREVPPETIHAFEPIQAIQALAGLGFGRRAIASRLGLKEQFVRNVLASLLPH